MTNVDDSHAIGFCSSETGYAMEIVCNIVRGNENNGRGQCVVCKTNGTVDATYRDLRLAEEGQG